MKTEEIKKTVNVVHELNGNCSDLMQSMKGTIREVKSAKKLWRQNNNPVLIKVGLALIAFPDPTVSDVLGAFLVAAGTVQQGIRRRTMYVEDVHKTFQSAMKEICATKNSV